MPAPEARSRARAFELLLTTTATLAFRRPALQASMTDCIVEPSCDAKRPSLMPTPVRRYATSSNDDAAIDSAGRGRGACPGGPLPVDSACASPYLGPDGRSALG